MAEKIDGHIQFNGVNWQFYKSFQPTLKCEFSDHRSCISKSAELNAAAASAEDGEAAAQVEATRLEVAKSADEQAAQAARDEVAEAGRRKHEATRQNGLVTQAAQDALKKKTADALAAALAYYQAETDAANERLASGMADIIGAQIKTQNDINATDWLAQVHAENVALAVLQKAADDKAKADAEAATKAAQDAKDAEVAAAQKAADDKAKADAISTPEPAQAQSPDAEQSGQSAKPETAPADAPQA